ncbi:MAG: energy transducer TonB [Polyangiaceae bacterium]|nr:energy transducer TonB [Polyangiaceae bacterium]
MTPPQPLPTGYHGALVPPFTELEIAAAVGGSFLIHVVFLAALVAVGLRAHIPEPEAPADRPEPIAVKPILDELPLLKLGGRKPQKYKLPDMWTKHPPIRRQEARSAPSPDAKDDPRAIPTSKVVRGDASAPPPDAEIAKEVDELQPDASEEDAAEATVEGEGSADGVKEGTETDPLKARAVSQYTMKILSWFNARFSPPGEGAPCAELKTMSTSVSASIGGDRTVVGYTVTRPSGNATFDAKVRSTMDVIVGQQLPPPPPLYPDILGASVPVTFSGRNAPCD